MMNPSEGSQVFKHRKLEVWQRGMRLAKYIHTLIASIPNDERYGLYSQLSRTSVSVPSNIAEGASRRSAKDFAHFLGIARGALAELDTQLELADDFGYLKYTLEAKEAVVSLVKQLNALVQKLSSEPSKLPNL